MKKMLFLGVFLSLSTLVGGEAMAQKRAAGKIFSDKDITCIKGRGSVEKLDCRNVANPSELYTCTYNGTSNGAKCFTCKNAWATWGWCEDKGIHNVVMH